MQIFKKKEIVIPVDENGDPIEVEKKKFDWKGAGKKVACGVLCAVGGILVFLAVGAAMINTDGESSDDASDSNSDDISSSEGDSSAESGDGSK